MIASDRRFLGKLVGGYFKTVVTSRAVCTLYSLHTLLQLYTALYGTMLTMGMISQFLANVRARPRPRDHDARARVGE